MEHDLGKQIFEALRRNQEAAQHILDAVTKPGAQRAPASRAGTSRARRKPVPDATPDAFADIAQTAQRMMQLMMQNGDEMLKSINAFWAEQLRVYAGTSAIAPDKDDHRFDDPSWRDNPNYRIAMQTYLSLRKGLDTWVDGLPVDHKQAESVRFMLSLLTEALAPSNWPTNPAAVKRYLATGGASAIRGLQHMVDDAVRNGGMPSMVKRDALKIGRDMATTPGKVVHRSEVFELIQYAPTTEQVYERPYLMVPPQINKYYFYDLSEKKSLIRFAVDAGLQTFAISWRNPRAAHSHWNFDTYIDAIEEAIDVVRKICGSRDVNVEGGCVAGLDVVALLADLAQRGERKVHSATLMVTMLDTSVETQLGVLATPQLIEVAKARSQMKGLLPGAELGRMFSFLRPNDLVWNYWVNNYLMGNDPPSFDVLAWNADTTRMTAAFHVQLLDLVKNNSLVRGEFKVRGKPVRLDSIECDQFWLAGLADHITPWRACYDSSRLLNGNRVFVVSDGGHIQSMISSPSNPKAKCFVNDQQPRTAEAWLEGATEQPGSWWLLWRDWITQRSGKRRKARSTLGSRAHPALADAPGTYVFE